MKTISQSKYLQAVALFTLAANAFREANRFEAELSRTLGFDDDYCGGGHLADAVVENGNVRDFEQAFKRDGFSVAKKKTTASRR